MSYDRLPTTIPMYNDNSRNPSDTENFASTSASASVSSPNPITQHRHRKRSSTASYGYGGYGYSSYSTHTSSRRRGPSLSPVRTNDSNWTNNIPIPSIPIPLPRFVRRVGSKLLRTPIYYLGKSIRAISRSNSVTTNSNSRRINLRKVKDPSPSFLPKIIWTLLLIASFTLLYLLLRIYEPHIELAFYSRKFAREEILPVKPLAGCFNRSSWRYNVTERLYGPRVTDVHAGLEMKFGLDCYEFAGTVRNPGPTPSHSSFHPRTQFHTYWRSDLATFGPRQEYMLKSFFATQNLATSTFILWSNGDMRENPILRKYLKRYGAVEGDQDDVVGSERGSFDVRVAEIAVLARGTELEYHANENEVEFEPDFFPPAHRLLLSDSKAWLDGDLIRLLLLWNFGGVWVDMDFLLTRDLEPLLEHEFVTQWDCYDKKYTPLNGALMRFHAYSPYLCEAFHIMATDSPPRPHSTDWGSTLYLKLYRRLVRGGVRPFKVLPWCFTEGRSCRLDNRLPDPFKEDHKAGIGWWEQDDQSTGRSNWWMPWTWWMTMSQRPDALQGSQGVVENPAINAQRMSGVDKPVSLATSMDVTYTGNPPALARALSQTFGIHLHNQWEKNFPKGGWVERLLLRRYESILEEERTPVLGTGASHGSGNLEYRLQGRDVDSSERDLYEGNTDLDSKPNVKEVEVIDSGQEQNGRDVEGDGETTKMVRKRHVSEVKRETVERT
ncbi:hypothetical protein DFJ43DRAFT_1058790 [Lentinula guzmanii]|uniref:Glycosyltransferase family 32 protein n=1 Tax=Lentinula guzmanii TaxID=2804957 RepID=A0AA38JYN8_9AGAR|nr:hypothetical protein DFJ43DRAFT_1058790 [Lentinula guzmanii]